MLDYFIPTAQAQGWFDSVSETANNAANTAAEETQTGIQGLITYVFSNIDNWIVGIIVVVVFYLLGNMGAATMKRSILKKREDVQESALILVERIAKIAIFTIGITIALAINGLNFTAVLGALSLGVGFALKDIIGNFISGVIMLSQNRFNIGDFIKVGEKVFGKIVSIDTRATILKAINGTEIVIPNQTMLGETIISYTTNPFRRVEFPIRVDYKTDLAMVTSLIKGILDKDEMIIIKPAPSVIVTEFAESSVNLSVRFWVETGTGWMRIRSNVIHKIKLAFEELGINIPFPTQRLKIDENDQAFLKTMASMKKGVVPDPDPTPTLEQVITAASKTEHKASIPYSIFEEQEKKGQTPSPEAMMPSAADPADLNKVVETSEIEEGPTMNVGNTTPSSTPAEIPYFAEPASLHGENLSNNPNTASNQTENTVAPSANTNNEPTPVQENNTENTTNIANGQIENANIAPANTNNPPITQADQIPAENPQEKVLTYTSNGPQTY